MAVRRIYSVYGHMLGHVAKDEMLLTSTFQPSLGAVIGSFGGEWALGRASDAEAEDKAAAALTGHGVDAGQSRFRTSKASRLLMQGCPCIFFLVPNLRGISGGFETPHVVYTRCD